MTKIFRIKEPLKIYPISLIVAKKASFEYLRRKKQHEDVDKMDKFMKKNLKESFILTAVFINEKYHPVTTQHIFELWEQMPYKLEF